MNTVRLGNALASKGVRVTHAVVRGGGSYESQVARDVDIVPLTGVPAGGSSTLSLLMSVLPLRRLVSRVRPDAVVAVMDHSAVVAALALRGRPEGHTRLVFNVQNNPVARARHGTILTRLTLKLAVRAYRGPNTIVALSHGVADELRRLSPGVAPVSVIHNIGFDDGVESLAGEPIRERIPEGRLLVAVGRLVEQKGYPFLLEALSEVVEHHDAILWVLGEGPERESLERLTRSLGLSDHVTFLGFRDNPYPYMAAADLFVLSSRWEGFGNVVAEAMAVGAPVVATDCPFGPSEVIEDGVSGLLVPPEDASELASAIIRVLDDRTLAGRLSESARHRARAFSSEVIASRWCELLALC